MDYFSNPHSMTLSEIFDEYDKLQLAKLRSFTGYYEFHNGWRIRGVPGGLQVGYICDPDLTEAGMVWFDWVGDLDWAVNCCFRGRASPPKEPEKAEPKRMAKYPAPSPESLPN